jgi:hypothetical protein
MPHFDMQVVNILLEKREAIDDGMALVRLLRRWIENIDSLF